MTRPADRGIALLEVLVAMMVLATSGLALAELVSAALRSETDAHAREGLLATEERVLTVMTLLDRNDLDRHLGRHSVGEFVVDVERPERTLYRIGLAEARTPDIDALVTVVYRPEEADAP